MNYSRQLDLLLYQGYIFFKRVNKIPKASAAKIFSCLNFLADDTPDPPNNYFLLHF